MQTRLTGHLEAGIEGVVAKRLNQAYLPTYAWTKVRTRTTAEAVVGGVLGPSTRRKRCYWAAQTPTDGYGSRGAPAHYRQLSDTSSAHFWRHPAAQVAMRVLTRCPAAS